MDANLQLASLIWLLTTFLTLACEQALADAPPEFRREPSSKIVKPFSRVKLRCTAHPKEADVRWTFNGQDVIDFPNIAVSEGALVIRTFESDESSFSHVGDYQCIASTSVGSIASRVARLDVAYIKKFSEKPPAEVSTWQGEVGVIPCSLPDSKPRARMEYSFKNRWITESTEHYRIMPCGNLHILNVSSSDAGLYSCSAVNPITNKRHSPRNGTLLVVRQGEPDEVERPPRIAYANGDLVSRADKATLECVTTGGRPGLQSVQWEKMDGDLSSAVTQRPGSLVLEAASLDDIGQYVCIAKYEGQEVDRQYVSLKVKKPPSIRTGPEDALANMGQPAAFSCSTGRALPEDVSWLHNAQQIVIDDTKYSLNERVLTVNDVQLDDLGMYQCLINSDEGSAQAAAQLQVQAGFPAIARPPEDTWAVEGEQVYLSCQVTGEPLPYITWEDPQDRIVRNNDKTIISEDSGGLNLIRVDLSDVGWYTCTASNKHGDVKASAYLSVSEKVVRSPTTPAQGVLGPPFSGAISDSGITTVIDNSEEESIKPGPPPEPPSKPRVAKISDTSVEVQWTYSHARNIAPVTHFTVQHMDVRSSEGWRTASENIGPLQRSFQVTNLSPTKIYRFRVIASNQHGQSPPSDMSHRYLLENLSPPVAPRGLPSLSPRIVQCLAESSSTIRVTWQYNPQPEDVAIDGFYVYIRHFDSDDDRDYVRTPVIGAHVRSYLIEKLEPEETYDIKVTSFNDAGESTEYNVVIRSTLPRETRPPPIIIGPSPDRGQHIPYLPDDPTPAPPHPPGGRGRGEEDILYITLGVVLGAMLLVLIMFAVMCVWRAKQVNRDSNAPVPWGNQPYYDPSYHLGSGKYPYINGKLNSNHSGPNGLPGRHSSFNELNGGIEPRPLYTLPQDALGGSPYIPCGTGSWHHESAPETSPPHQDYHQLRQTPSTNYLDYPPGLTNGTVHTHRTSSNHELGHTGIDGGVVASSAPRPVCQIRVNPSHHQTNAGAGQARINVHDRPNRTGSSREGLHGSSPGSLTLSLPTMPPDLQALPTPGSPPPSGPCCDVHTPPPSLTSPRPRSASSQSEASSHHSSNQSESSSHHSSAHQSQLSSHHSSSSKITDV